jgi:hypothetical protein
MSQGRLRLRPSETDGIHASFIYADLTSSERAELRQEYESCRLIRVAIYEAQVEEQLARGVPLERVRIDYDACLRELRRIREQELAQPVRLLTMAD